MKALLVALAALVLLAAVATAQAPSTVNLSNAFRVVPGAAQGMRGDLLFMPAGTIQGVHVIQGGSRECLDPDVDTGLGPCPERARSLDMDIGTGSSSHRGRIAVCYDVCSEFTVWNGYKRRRIRVSRGGVTLRGRVVACDSQGCIDVLRAIRGLRHRWAGS